MLFFPHKLILIILRNFFKRRKTVGWLYSTHSIEILLKFKLVDQFIDSNPSFSENYAFPNLFYVSAFWRIRPQLTFKILFDFWWRPFFWTWINNPHKILTAFNNLRHLNLSDKIDWPAFLSFFWHVQRVTRSVLIKFKFLIIFISELWIYFLWNLRSILIFSFFSWSWLSLIRYFHIFQYSLQIDQSKISKRIKWF